MSPTRKPKPPDKGAPPVHKPSRKVALDEVMRTLQDLVSNELATETDPAAHVERKPAARTRKTGATEDTATNQATDKPDSLPSIVSPEVTPAAPETSSSLHTSPSLPASAAHTTEEVSELPVLDSETTATPTATTMAADNQVPPGGIQQELPYLDASSPVASNELPPPASVPSVTESALDSLEPVATASQPEEIHYDDFPVLEEVVEHAEDYESDEPVESDYPDSRPSSSANLPRADSARRLAIQVAARLNVELRKSGQAGLSSDVITRLARLLQEALAKGASNMENTPARDSDSAKHTGAALRTPSDKQ